MLGFMQFGEMTNPAEVSVLAKKNTTFGKGLLDSPYCQLQNSTFTSKRSLQPSISLSTA